MNRLPLELLTYTALSPTTPASQGTEGGTFLVLPVADTPPSTGQGILTCCCRKEPMTKECLWQAHINEL